uniref:Uncharacterized protein n=1 Tax=Vitis vinifera TaxID=29760 RepID=F6GV94_VITVI
MEIFIRRILIVNGLGWHDNSSQLGPPLSVFTASSPRELWL